MTQNPEATLQTSSEAAPLIDLKQLCFSYPFGDTRLDVLRGVDLQLQEGETVAVLGPSGSGKTSLLLLLAGLEQPESGTIRLGNDDLASLDQDTMADIRRDRLGIVFQSFHLMPSLTALGNVMLPLEIAERDKAGEQAMAMLDRVGLADRAAHYPAQLSGGEQQRVAIARALVHRPGLLLADEPTGNLDSKTGARIIDLLFELNTESGSGMLLVTHDEAIAERCQRVVRLQSGQLVEDGVEHELEDGLNALSV